MDPIMKERWIAALESDQYQQGEKLLRDENNRYCCLGVLCDLDGEEWEERKCQYEGRILYSYLGSDGYLPSALNTKYEVDESNEAFLTYMNDNGTSFKEIAKWIRENL